MIEYRLLIEVPKDSGRLQIYEFKSAHELSEHMEIVPAELRTSIEVREVGPWESGTLAVDHSQIHGVDEQKLIDSVQDADIDIVVGSAPYHNPRQVTEPYQDLGHHE